MQEEGNKNQQSSMPRIDDSIMVKDRDGSLKVLKDGELRELDTMLSETAVGDEPKAQTSSEGSDTKHMELMIPTFQDLAPVPEDEHFKESIPEVQPADTKEKKQLQFHSDDAQDIEKELAKLTQAFSIAPQKKYSIKKIAEKLDQKHNLKLSEEDLNKFAQVLLSFFRQVRNATATKEALTDPQSGGGFSIAPDAADHIISVASHLRDKIEEQDGVVVDREAAPGVASAETKAAVTLEEKPQPQPETSVPTSDSLQEPQLAPQPMSQTQPVMPTMDETPQQTEGETVIKQEQSQQSMPAEVSQQMEQPAMTEPSVSPAPEVQPQMDMTQQPAPQPEAIPEASVQKTEEDTMTQEQSVEPAISAEPEVSKQQPMQEEQPKPIEPVDDETPSIPKVKRKMASIPNIQDVKTSKKDKKKGPLTGRVDELAGMTLQRWRMLDQDPRIRAGKILGKIQNLQQESFMRKSQGIEAWRSSEVYQHYLHIGQQSLEQKKDVSQVIEEIKAQGYDTLGIDEFEAVSDLNRTLRY